MPTKFNLLYHGLQYFTQTLNMTRCFCTKYSNVIIKDIVPIGKHVILAICSYVALNHHNYQVSTPCIGIVRLSNSNEIGYFIHIFGCLNTAYLKNNETCTCFTQISNHERMIPGAEIPVVKIG